MTLIYPVSLPVTFRWLEVVMVLAPGFSVSWTLARIYFHHCFQSVISNWERFAILLMYVWGFGLLNATFILWLTSAIIWHNFHSYKGRVHNSSDRFFSERTLKKKKIQFHNRLKRDPYTLLLTVVLSFLIWYVSCNNTGLNLYYKSKEMNKEKCTFQYYTA